VTGDLSVCDRCQDAGRIRIVGLYEMGHDATAALSARLQVRTRLRATPAPLPDAPSLSLCLCTETAGRHAGHVRGTRLDSPRPPRTAGRARARGVPAVHVARGGAARVAGRRSPARRAGGGGRPGALAAQRRPAAGRRGCRGRGEAHRGPPQRSASGRARGGQGRRRRRPRPRRVGGAPPRPAGPRRCVPAAAAARAGRARPRRRSRRAAPRCAAKGPRRAGCGGEAPTSGGSACDGVVAPPPTPRSRPAPHRKATGFPARALPPMRHPIPAQGAPPRPRACPRSRRWASTPPPWRRRGCPSTRSPRCTAPSRTTRRRGAARSRARWAA
jgi:hypothetical protein